MPEPTQEMKTWIQKHSDGAALLRRVAELIGYPSRASTTNVDCVGQLIADCDAFAVSAEMLEAILEKLEPRAIPKSAWKIAEEWYRESEITHSILRSKRLLAERSERIPEDVYSPEFAKWLTDQYRLAMAKGIEMGRRNET